LVVLARRRLRRLDTRARQRIRSMAPTESQRIFALTIIIGVICGLVAVAFHVAIRLVGSVAINPAYDSGRAWPFWIVLTPVLGGLLSGVLLHYVAPNARGSGVPQVKLAFAAQGGRLRFRDSVGKFIISAIQIGSGSSLGREGPTVQICAGVASGLGRMLRISPSRLRQLLPVGAAAGIAAAFNTPIAAVTFTIEEVVGKLDQTLLSGVVVAAAFAAVIERSVLGEHPMFAVPQSYGLQDTTSLVFYALLGIAAAIVSVVFTDALLKARGYFKYRSKLPAWARPAIGGLVTGALAVVVMAWLRTRGVTGGGYETLAQALSGGLPIKLLLVLCAAKIVATVLSYGSGGAGGIFAPSLFIGGMLGGAIGELDVALLDHAADTKGAFALVGMGAMFAGIIRAPMTSVLIIFEMTGSYSLILPLMIANMTSYMLARHWRRAPIYEALLAQDGIDLSSELSLDVLQTLRLQEIMVPDRAFIVFERRATMRELMERTRNATWQGVYPVVEASGKPIGLITREDLQLVARQTDLSGLISALDIMRPAVLLRPSDDLRTVFEVLLANSIREAPVVDHQGTILGFIDEAEIVRAYLAATSGKHP
jgi:chloride channel protein, CIC family